MKKESWQIYYESTSVAFPQPCPPKYLPGLSPSDSHSVGLVWAWESMVLTLPGEFHDGHGPEMKGWVCHSMGPSND